MKTSVLQSRYFLIPFLLFIVSTSLAQLFVVEARKNTSPWGVLNDQVLCADDQLLIRIDLGMKPKLWLDAMDINSGIEPTPGSRINNWQDKSGNNFTIVAPNLELRPSYDPTGFNGLPAVMFGMDNQPDGLELFDASEDDFFENDWSIAILGQGKERASGVADLIGNATAGANGWSFGFNDLGLAQTKIGSNLKQTGSPRERPYTFITVLIKEGNRFRTYIDGVLEEDFIIQDGVTISVNTALYLGQANGGDIVGERYHKGAIVELLVFDRSIDHTERINLEGYLANKWMSNENLSVSHSFKTFSPLNVLMKTPADSVVEFTSYHQEFLFDPTKASDFGDFTFTPKGESVPSDTINIRVTAELSTPENAISYAINNTAFTQGKEATVSFGNTIVLKPTFGGDYQWQAPEGRYLPENTNPTIVSVESGYDSGMWEIYYYQGGCLNSDKAFQFNVKSPSSIVSDIPGVLEAENFISKSPIIKIEDGGSNKNISSIKNNSFTEYNVDIKTAGDYEVAVWTSTAADAGGTLQLSFNGSVIGAMEIPSSTGWTTYKEYKTTITINDISSGKLRLDFTTTNAYAFNIDKLEFKLDVVSTTSGSINSEEVMVYPNPSESGVFKFSQETNWEVYSIQGMFLLEGKGHSVDLSNKGKGIYLLKMNHAIQKIIVE